MSVKVDVKYNNSVIDSLTSTGEITYATADKYLANDIKVDFTGTEDATATANKILNGYTAYIADGSKATGTIPTKAAATYTASTNDQTISLAQYLAGDQTIKAVSLNATASNMLANTLVSIESNGSTVTSVSGSIQTWNGEKKPLPDLCFTANTAGSTISMKVTGTSTLNPNFQTSIDGSTWTNFIPGTTVITLANTGDKVYFKGNNPGGISEAYRIYYKFVMTGRIAASGNIMSLIDNGSCTCTTIPNNFCFYQLFDNCDALISAPDLPATTLAESCYAGMFSGCSNLDIAPVLPAQTLAVECYSEMFCYTGLVVPPVLPAETVEEYCYLGMFSNCSELTTVPELPATIMKGQCYFSMFQGCTKLTTPPVLPATTLAYQCYQNMFNGCTALTTVPVLPATKLAVHCYANMFYGCTSLIISDTSGEGYDKSWTLPTSGTFTQSIIQYQMFQNCAGTRSSDNMAGAAGQSYTYYTQNTPV